MIKAKTKNEFFRVLHSTIDISVPIKGKGRTKEHTEKYALAHLLSMLAVKNAIQYPIEVQKRERPDFELLYSNNKIGIEHTEAISENQARIDLLRNKGYGPPIQSIIYSAPGEKAKKIGKLIEEIESNSSPLPRCGDRVEREWTEAMRHFTNKKIISAQKEGYEKFEENWLLIYDNWRLPALDISEAARIFSDICQNDNLNHYFTKIFVLTISDKILCEFFTNGYDLHPINKPGSKPTKR